jgi:hypothetical protein
MAKEDKKESGRRFAPHNYLRARRPERFSDSIRSARPVLDRSVLEYQLDTLTSRNQETQFEEFARQLAQREICPNLIPHTGPTGGGDSKVDSETYPVAPTIAAGWYVGVGLESARERWAFAMSAKKDWKGKIRSDVRGIIGTDRGYVKIFFISNQSIKDKDRALEEDKLSREYGLDVRIFDRSWILDRVFANHHEQLAIQTLGLSVTVIDDEQKGPRDLKRERDLVDVERRIQDGLQAPTLAYVDDCLKAAKLARSLELPRVQIDGRFERAIRAAKEHGTPHQQVVALYEHAWTTFWWHEDLKLFLQLYDQVEGLVVETDNVVDAELLNNLWSLVAASSRNRHITEAHAKLNERTTALKSTLTKLAGHIDRPSTSLQSRALIALMDLISAIPEQPTAPIEALSQIVEEAGGLIGFPLVRLSDLIGEISEFYVGNEAFSQLFDSLVDVVGRRQGEVVSARMLLRLAAQYFERNKPYDTIKTAGKALRKLYKHESRREMVKALTLCGLAYERVGLLWAARGTLLNAASIAANDWWQQSKVTADQFRSYNRIKWIELQLGRLPQILAWHETDAAVRAALVQEGYSPAQLDGGERDFDGLLGILLLRADLWQLKQLETLPDVLHRFDLHTSGLALIFALGHDDEFQAGDDLVTRQKQVETFTALSKQPAGDELPAIPQLHSERILNLRSVILGAVIETTVDNGSPEIELAESILAALEALLATSVLQGIMPYTSTFQVRIRRSDFAEFPFKFETTDNQGIPGVNIRCSPFKPNGLSPDEQADLKTAIGDVVTNILTRGFFISGPDTLERLLGEERGFERAIDFTGSFGTVQNVLGSAPKFLIQDWTDDQLTRFELLRHEEWDAVHRRDESSAQQTATEVEQLEPGEGPVPDDLFDLSNVKHSDIRFESIIRGPSWDRADWKAIGWASVEGSDKFPPWMILGFTNASAAIEVIEQLVRDLGNYDPKNRLRITILRGISRKNPSHYRVVIGSNIDSSSLKKFGNWLSRVHTMTPDNNANLDRFLKSYESSGSFYLGVGVVDLVKMQPPTPFRDGWIQKKQLRVRNAWEIGMNDPDIAGVNPDDDVVIPPQHRTDAPVLELLRWKAERVNESGWTSVPGAKRRAKAKQNRQKTSRRSRKANRGRR